MVEGTPAKAYLEMGCFLGANFEGSGDLYPDM